MLNRALFFVFRLICFGLAAVGLYATSLSIQATILGYHFDFTPFFLFTYAFAFMATVGYLFLGLRIQKLLPTHSRKVMGFLLLLVLVNITGHFLLFYFPQIAHGYEFAVPEQTTPAFISDLFTSSILDILLIWIVYRYSRLEKVRI